MTLHELFPPSLAPVFRLVGAQLIHLDVTREEGCGDKGRAQHLHWSFHQKEVYSCAMWSDATMEKNAARQLGLRMEERAGECAREGGWRRREQKRQRQKETQRAWLLRIISNTTCTTQTSSEIPPVLLEDDKRNERLICVVAVWCRKVILQCFACTT